ncbi:TonB-dependent receptor [Sphingomonas sp. SRS2]|uniref:TonB-dependent receptor n=1 Tax=Sphingomonas sp. SRS2 TaxID=133190 RepID=UPI000618447D|nr:TonB-dependent receptor [Sphingomonas sp. SRS2]KKC25982.1 hypothetical protein WP12_11110 [Sphingomonas sp. SRS2]
MGYPLKTTVLLLCSAALTPLTPALAQVAQPGESDAVLQDIVVTAQKRATNVQDTPLALTAVSGAELAARRVVDIETLAPSLPNVNFGKNVGFARIAIRGLGLDTTVAGQEGRVAYHLDGVYISRPTAALATFFDVERVEVVRGPQGTLYGRNATAGAVNVISSSPEFETGGYAKLTIGNYGLFSTQGAITGAVNDKIAARIAISTTDRKGYGRNLSSGEQIDNEHNYAGRAKLLIRPSDTIDIMLSADYSRQDDNNFVYHYLGAGNPNVVPFAQAGGGLVPANPRDTFGNVDQINKRRFYGFLGTVDIDLGAATLTSVTGYRHSNSRYLTEGDGTQLAVSAFHILERASQFSEELRLAGKTGNLNYLFGLYYFDEKVAGRTRFTPLRSPVPPNRQVQGLDYIGDQGTTAYAAFGQLDYEIVDGLTLSAGARYSYEKKSIDQRGVADFATPYNPAVPSAYNLFQDASKTYKKFTPKITVQYEPTSDLMVYATYSKGFKSGGYSLTAFVAPVEPENLTDYEVGLKAEFLDRKVRTNLAAFYYDYTNLQVQIIQGASAIPLNAASAKVQGVEFELAAKPFANFEVSGNAAWLDSEYKGFATVDAARPALGVLDLSGNRLSQAPRYTVNFSAQYTVPTDIGDFSLRGEGKWVGRVYFSPFNRIVTSQAAHEKYNAYLNFERPGGFNASLFILNIANKRTVSTSQVSAGFIGSPIMGAFDPPRTYGASVGMRF